MKKYVTILSIIIFCSKLSIGQKRPFLELDLGSELLLGSYPYLMGMTKLNYNFSFFTAYASYSRELFSPSGDVTLYSGLRPEFYPDPILKRQLRNYSILSTGLLGNFRFKNVKGFLGVGIYREYFGGILESKSEKEIVFGYQIDKLVFTVRRLNPFSFLKRNLLSISYRLPIIKRKSNFYQKKRVKPISLDQRLFRIAIYTEFNIPISAKYRSWRYAKGLTVGYYLANKFHFFANASVYRIRGHGGDELEFAQDSFGRVFESQRLSHVSNYGIGVNKVSKFKGDNVFWEYGVGLNLLKYNGPRFEIEEGSNSFEEVKLSTIALSTQAQLTYGPFSNGVQLSIPVSELSPMVNVYWSIGLNFKRKKK